MKGSAVENLITEIRLLKTLQHPHIVRMKDFQWDEKYVYIIMEYCNSGDLSKYLKKKPIPEYLCKKLLRHLALALKELRQRDIVHMDLKPQNLLLHKPTDEDFILKVADFGFAQYMSDEAENSSMRGSPLYMAPEMFLSCSASSPSHSMGYGVKVDLWSVGVILYECLFGRAPYSSNSYKLLEEKIKSQQKIEIPSNAGISADCRELLDSLLKHDPTARIDYEDFFNHSFLDMKHTPSSENYKKATDLVCQAIEKDSKKEFEDAYHLYCESLRYFVPMVTEETNLTRKNELRNKVKRYIKRAEQLKMFTVSGMGSTIENSRRMLGETNTNQPGTSASRDVDEEDSSVAIKSNTVAFKKSSRDEALVTEELSVESFLLKKHAALSREKFDQLYSLCKSSKGLQSGLEVGASAEMYVQEGKLEEALKRYRGALNTLLKGCQAEPQGHRRTLLVNKIDEWLKEAESIKALLESREIQESLYDEDQSHCALQ